MPLTGTFNHVRIAAIAAAVPETVVPNAAFVETLGERGVRKFERMTGIHERRHVCTLTTEDLAAHAAETLRRSGHWDAETLDACVFVSQMPSAISPATACLLHGRLGLRKGCLAFDIGLGCSGFVYGLHVVGALIESGAICRALLVGGDCISRVAEPSDIPNQMLFGDAGFAAVIERTEEAAPLHWLLGTDGSGAEAIYAAGHNPWAKTTMPNGKTVGPWLVMDGLAVFNFTINVIPGAIRAFCEAHRLPLEGFGHFCLHQANRFILSQVADLTGFDDARNLVSIDRYGNTSSASIPLTLCDAANRTGVDGGGCTLLAGFGVGLSWGIAALDLRGTSILPPFIMKEPEA